jgi:hypothetical protein
MSSDILEVFKQMSFLSSVLAGFAITVAIELISLAQKKPLVTAAIAVFLISSVMSAVATFIFVVVMTAAIGPPGFPHPNEAWILHFVGGIGVLPFGGLILFLAGIGLVGWIRSKLLGVITTVSALLGLGLVLYILRGMSTVQ